MLDLAEGIHSHLQEQSIDLPFEACHLIAIGIIENLFHFTARYAADGGIGKHSEIRIARGLKWPWNKAYLVSLLRDAGFLDSLNNGLLYVHDWHVHSDETADKWLADNGLRYANGKPTRRVGKSRDKSRQSEPEPESEPLPEPESKSEPESVPESEPIPLPPDGVAEFVEAWNNTPGVVRISRMTGPRKNRLRTRLSEDGWEWQQALAKFPLRCFEDNERGWKPDFDWFVRPDTVVKILEGKYDWNRIQNHKAEQDPRGNIATAQRYLERFGGTDGD